ncbi:MAG: pyruvate:ferredoxin (flavodoxin) oxidoreductase, partial [Proteobacteria bacterium]|nr:pyruvate:ferredoxin (flavodoxin) oxidoreductase [Pseudomonadota bacterium]
MAIRKTIDGNEAAAHSAFMTNEVICIYPITPSSTMAELSDDWASKAQTNMWGQIPRVVEMQSEAGAAGAVHGSLQAGALTTTFTASQGLLLKIPNMFKIAGELTPAVFHIAARCLASHALSIFGDHSDVMHARTTGFALLSSTSVQEAQDMAMIAQMATLKSRVPFLHFFDGFRTSHEVNRIDMLSLDDARALIDEDLCKAHHDRALKPENPSIRGTAQNPDIFFQAREACNPYYDAVPGIVREAMKRFEERTGRSYDLFNYYGAADAERVVILMGSAVGAAEEACDALNAAGEKVGVLTVHLYRPFDAKGILAALPKTVKAIAVLDRTKEPGSLGEPLYLDVVAAVAENWREIVGTAQPTVIGGRYGLSSKEFTPAMAKAVLDELKKDAPKNHFTVGIHDDLTKHSIAWDPSFITEDPENTRAIFFGLGSDGTVGANKNSIKIIGENTPLNAQGYFVYDSKKSGGETVSHLRFGKKPIKGAYLIQRANFVAVHQFGFIEKKDVLANAADGATLLVNCPYSADEAWNHIPAETQKQIIDKKIKLYVIDAGKVAAATGMGNRINTVMQACFFKLSGVLPEEEAIMRIKEAAKKAYSKKGEAVVQKNYAAIDASIENLYEVAVPNTIGDLKRVSMDYTGAPEYVQKIMSKLVKDEGENLPTSAFDADGHFPTATTKWEKRGIAREIPVWDPTSCIGCAFCSISCPHAAIRIKTFKPEAIADAPATFTTREWKGKEVEAGSQMRIQVYADDCTGCGVCVGQCPAAAKGALKMA